MGKDTIYREDAIKVAKAFLSKDDDWFQEALASQIRMIPSADRPQGEWKEKTEFHNADDDSIIEEWQSAKCSVCGKYHTTPYLYYFDDYNYCPHCGAKMKGADDE